jgi:ketosteroid isomerase-like protein
VTVSIQVQAAETANSDLFGKKTTEFYEAMKKKDSAGLTEMFTDDFLYTNVAGETTNKQAYVDALAKYLTVEAYTFRPIAVNIYGEAAIAVYQVTLKATAGGNPWNPQLTATDTWIKQKGVWKMAAHHVSPIIKR